MAVEDTDVVDFITDERATGALVLTIVDSLSWEPLDEQVHLELLQAKLNAYLRFLESGEVLRHCPDACSKELVIEVTFMNHPSPRGLKILASARAIIEEAGFSLRLRSPNRVW
ncbi:MAG: hypothetical protein BroJett014_32990 [Planctomycetota bacterium]|nr:MAG: hypothetical protein BroJett014_32990 [Planctomycetota bacterium]